MISNNPQYKSFHIHGDNIVECERTLSIIIGALGKSIKSFDGPLDSAVAPSFCLNTQEVIYKFTFFPGYGRWVGDILSMVRTQRESIREAADAIITHVVDGNEIPLIAIEYCGALPAGNQAWQRNGRAYSFAQSKVPYLYITEIGGYELTSDRIKKSTRLPNPAVPFSYLMLSANLKTMALPIFILNAGAGTATDERYSRVLGYNDLLKMVQSIIIGESYEESLISLERKVLEFVKILASGHKRRDTLSVVEWDNAYKHIILDKELPEYLSGITPIKWAKTAYIDGLTTTAKKFMSLASKYAIGLTSSSLPMCLILKKDRNAFAKELELNYPGLPVQFSTWLRQGKDLAICWVMGFKPRGDDARPDRGLPPLTRMLIGEKSDLLTFVYGPAPKATWPLLESEPIKLMQANGLWQAIMSVSDAILIDSSTADGLKTRAFVKVHWESKPTTSPLPAKIVQPQPLQIGENDVDTVLHLLFARLGHVNVFEGMCNPPGGDWSGMSMLSQDRSLESRWLSLPRVTSEDAKRPDHLFQISNIAANPIVLIVESKEKAKLVENDIGLMLKEYIKQLCSSLPSVERENPTGNWINGTHKFDLDSVAFVSAAAFVMDSATELAATAKRTQVDIVLGLAFSKSGNKCSISFYANSEAGETVGKFISNLGKSGFIEILRFQ